MEQSKSNTSSEEIILVKELLVKIDNQVHKFGYMSEDHKYLTLQDISYGMNQGTQYIRNIIGKEIIFTIATGDSDPLGKGKRVNLREFSQLIALGVPTQVLIPYIQDENLPRVARELQIGEPFTLKDSSGTAGIELIVTKADITRGYDAPTTVEITAENPAEVYCHLGCGPEFVSTIHDAMRRYY